MKKILTILLVLAIFLGNVAVLTSCNALGGDNKETSAETTVDISGNTETERGSSDIESGDVDTEGDNTEETHTETKPKDTEYDSEDNNTETSPEETSSDEPTETETPSYTKDESETDNETESVNDETADDNTQTEDSDIQAPILPDITETTESETQTTEPEPETSVVTETDPLIETATETDTHLQQTESSETETESCETETESCVVETDDNIETTDTTNIETELIDTDTDTLETDTAETDEAHLSAETESIDIETETRDDEEQAPCTSHVDADQNDYCDTCTEYLIVILDFYVLNDLHGKFCDTATQPGVDELGTYFENRARLDDNIILLSTGDMWQGTAESSLLRGKIIVEWMNTLGFEAMTLGNHEFDWGEDPIRENVKIADFPFLAINVYDKKTNKLADYCTPSVIIERDGIKIGIIGAIGDSLSSIASNMVEGVTFKVGSELTALVKAESQKLRAAGADIIVYSVHDGKDDEAYTYDASLSNGYVDVVFEAHTHQSYTTVDSYGVYHIQAGGENEGLSHIEISIHSLSGNKTVTEANVITNSAYKYLDDHQKTEELEDKYSDIIDFSYAELGIVSNKMTDAEVEDFVAQLYLETGLEKWGSKYNIVLGGGFLRTRTPYELSAGKKTYADIFSLLPFDNQIVLCSISGRNLKNKFINSTNSDYHIALSEYGEDLNISNNSTYYVVVDSYTAFFSSNGLTIKEYLDQTTFARDLFSDAIKDGRLYEGDNDYRLTSIDDVLSIGQTLAVGKSTTEVYYVKGTVKNITNTTYGNFDLVDENGNKLYIYGLKDVSGNLYGSMTNPPKENDVIIVKSTIYRYSSTTIELKYAILVE